MSTVVIQLFATARDVAQTAAQEITLPENATVKDVRIQLIKACPALSVILSRSRIAVNEEFADDAVVLPANATIAVIPPVSGG